MSMQKLTWDELADIYHKTTGGRARTMPMEKVFKWAEKRIDLFKLNKDETLSFIGKE